MRSATRADRRARWVFAVCGALILCGGQARAGGQSAAPPRDPHAPDLTAGTGIIRGRVVSGASESVAPIRDARVSVRSSSGSPDPVFTDVFATSADHWYQGSRFLAFTRPKMDGAFEIGGLPPGQYYVAAVDRLQGTAGFGEWQDPAFLESIAPRAARVTVRDGQLTAVIPRLIVR